MGFMNMESLWIIDEFFLQPVNTHTLGSTTKYSSFLQELVKAALSLPFIRMTYDEAMTLLQDNSQHFQTKPSLGDDLGKEHELFLTNHAGNRPVFVTDWPKKTKAFYMRARDDNPDVVSICLLSFLD